MPGRRRPRAGRDRRPAPAGSAGGPGALGTLAGRRATIRLGEHITWLTLDGGLPGQAPALARQRRLFLDELGRWLSAYLSGQIRDQLLLSDAGTKVAVGQRFILILGACAYGPIGYGVPARDRAKPLADDAIAQDQGRLNDARDFAWMQGVPGVLAAADRAGGPCDGSRRWCAAAVRLLRAASAVLGEERAALLRDALAERAAQLVRVGEAVTAVPKRQPPAALASPGPASLAAWERCRDRIEALEGRLRAWAWQAPLAGERRSGGAAGALDGYVVGVKDVIDVAGMPTRAGSPLTSPAPVWADAPAVARLRAAGAAIAGKTHCTQWRCPACRASACSPIRSLMTSAR
jgi:hypothetical protein